MAKEKFEDEEFEVEDNEALDNDAETANESNERPIPRKNITDNFIRAISDYLNEFAQTDLQFAEKMKNPNKNTDQCCGYILEEVKKSGVNGFDDSEIFAMARHYYNEEDVQGNPASKMQCKVVINSQVELTPEDIERARKKAVQQFENEELERLRKQRENAEKEAAKKAEKEAKAAAKKAEKELKAAARKAELEKKKKQEKIFALGVEQIDLFEALQ